MTETSSTRFPSFRRRLHIATAALAAIIAALAAFAVYGAGEIDQAALRSRNAQTTLAAHITLSSSAYNLFKQMSDAALLNDLGESEHENRIIEIVHRDIRNARKTIAEEVKEAGAPADEVDELERLAAVEREIGSIIAAYYSLRVEWPTLTAVERRRSIAALLDTRIDLTFNRLISAAINEERQEAVDANARLTEVSAAIRGRSIAVALLSAPLIGFVLYYLNRDLLHSLRALSDGAEAYAKGELDHQIAPLGSAEFEGVRLRLARMASELGAGRETLRAANESLEKEVEKRTAELADAYSRLEEADEQRRSFFADVSHELRTPLTVIRGEAEVALRGSERRAVDYRGSLARIVEQAEQMGRLVEDLLFIARADAGEPRLEMRSVALDGLLCDSARSFEALAAARGLQISLEGRDDGAVVAGDRGRLAQVLGVLLDNAVRYSREGGEVRLSSHIDGAHAVIDVEDDGIGIAPADIDHVFERFYRADNAREQSGGAGLGLPVAKAIIEAHNGRIRLSASASGGVRASITLPVETKLRAIS